MRGVGGAAGARAAHHGASAKAGAESSEGGAQAGAEKGRTDVTSEVKKRLEAACATAQELAALADHTEAVAEKAAAAAYCTMADELRDMAETTRRTAAHLLKEQAETLGNRRRCGG